MNIIHLVTLNSSLEQAPVEANRNMSLRDIQLKAAYDSDEDDILNDFYVLALANSTAYLRLVGFFSSSTLAVAARGIAEFIKNGGKMKLVVGAKLRRSDVEAIRKGIKSRNQAIVDAMIEDLDSIESEFVRDHVRALGWMVANEFLDIKVAIPFATEGIEIGDEGIYHQKVGILYDNQNPQNCISFSGSINESKMGWLNSIEEFKVFRSWVKGEETYLKSDVEKFGKYWSGNAKRAIVIDFPTAVRGKMIEMAPETLDELHLERHYYRLRKKPWQNQVEAIQAWADSGFKGILSMATGSGKTLAALYASSLAPRSTITIILVPTIPLLRQWGDRDIPDYDDSARVIMCSGNNPEWKTLLPLELADIRRIGKDYDKGTRFYVVAVMKTAATEGFLRLWDGISPENVQIMCDEVHHIGAPTYQSCMRLPSSRRLGLSATPEREWDPIGTTKIKEYFGPTIYDYGIKRAIEDKRLCRYTYHPFFAFLDKNEFDNFYRLSIEINRELARLETKGHGNKSAEVLYANDQEPTVINFTQKLEKLLLQRSMIKKKAEDKPRVFRQVLRETSSRPLIVYCEDHEQVEKIRAVLQDEAIGFVVYTSKMTNSQRRRALDVFRKGRAEVLLAIRCLDEGLDVPECEGCIIVASSSSARQFIQRRGRILRVGSTGKVAVLNDIIVLPAQVRDVEQTDVARTLVRQELHRVYQLAEASENEWEVRNTIRDQLAEYGLQELANI